MGKKEKRNEKKPKIKKKKYIFSRYSQKQINKAIITDFLEMQILSIRRLLIQQNQQRFFINSGNNLVLLMIVFLYLPKWV